MIRTNRANLGIGQIGGAIESGSRLQIGRGAHSDQFGDYCESARWTCLMKFGDSGGTGKRHQTRPKQTQAPYIAIPRHNPETIVNRQAPTTDAKIKRNLETTNRRHKNRHGCTHGRRGSDRHEHSDKNKSRHNDTEKRRQPPKHKTNIETTIQKGAETKTEKKQ